MFVKKCWFEGMIYEAQTWFAVAMGKSFELLFSLVFLFVEEGKRLYPIYCVAAWIRDYVMFCITFIKQHCTYLWRDTGIIGDLSVNGTSITNLDVKKIFAYKLENVGEIISRFHMFKNKLVKKAVSVWKQTFAQRQREREREKEQDLKPENASGLLDYGIRIVNWQREKSDKTSYIHTYKKSSS